MKTTTKTIRKIKNKKRVTKKRVTKKRVTKKRVTKKRVTKKKTAPVKETVPVQDISSSEPKQRKRKKLTTSKLICSKCKTEKKTTKQQIERLIGQFGSLEDVHDRYHCMDCRRKYNLRKDGRLKPEKRQRKRKLKSEMTSRPDISLPCTERNREVQKRYGNIIGKSMTWRKPDGVSDKKWETTIRNTVLWGIDNGILRPVKKG